MRLRHKCSSILRKKLLGTFSSVRTLAMYRCGCICVKSSAVFPGVPTCAIYVTLYYYMRANKCVLVLLYVRVGVVVLDLTGVRTASVWSSRKRLL
jgi:hypothetical protein